RRNPGRKHTIISIGADQTRCRSSSRARARGHSICLSLYCITVFTHPRAWDRMNPKNESLRTHHGHCCQRPSTDHLRQLSRPHRGQDRQGRAALPPGSARRGACHSREELPPARNERASRTHGGGEGAGNSGRSHGKRQVCGTRPGRGQARRKGSTGAGVVHVPVPGPVIPAADYEAPTEEKTENVDRTHGRLEAEGDSPVVLREKTFAAAPIGIEEALNRMELVGHDFYLFIDEESSKPSVVYRRKGWSYGVIALDHQLEEVAD